MPDNIAPPKDKKKSSKIYYGYIVLVASFFIMALVFGSQNSFGVYFKPMLNEFGWTRAATSGPFALSMLLTGLFGIFAGGLCDKYGPWKIVTLGSFILSVGYLLSSRITELWQLYVYYGVVVAVGQSAIYVTILSTLARWFTSRRGLISGIGISGLGFGIGVMPIISSYFIESFSWRTAFLILGAMCLVLLLSLAQFLKRRPVTAASTDTSPLETKFSLRRDLTLAEALHTRRFWLICVSWLLYGFFAQLGIVHIVPYATDLGMPAVAAATVLTAIGIVGVFGRVALGFIGDRLGNRLTIYLCFALIAVVFIGLAASSTLWMLYLFAIIFGSLFGIGVLLGPVVVEYFGLKGMGAISGAIIFAYCTGGAVGPILAGGIFDSTGSYHLAFLACGISGFAASLIVWLLRSAPRR